MTNFILNNKFSENKENVDKAKQTIEAAANLITADIRDIQYDTEQIFWGIR